MQYNNFYVFKNSSINRIAYSQLIKMGVHIGHTYRNSFLYASWLIYGFRQEIAVINLYKFVHMFRIGFSCLDMAIFKLKSIWFANQHRNYGKYVEFFAFKCGEFSSTKYWIRGMLSNYWSVCDSFRAVTSKSGVVKSRKNKLFDFNFQNWHLTRFSWPGVIFIPSVKNSYFATAEAYYGNVPCLGVVDTNTFSQSCTVAIPGNDDSINSIIFYNDLVCEYILYRKFAYVFMWFLRTRRSKRLVDFNDWFSTKNKLTLNSFTFLNFKKFNYLSKYNFNELAVKLYSAKNIWLNKVINFITLTSLVSFNIYDVLENFENSQEHYSFCFSHFFFRRVAFFRKFFIRGRRKIWKLNNKKFLAKLSRFNYRFFWKSRYLNRFFRFRAKRSRRRFRIFFKIFLHYFFFVTYYKFGFYQLQHIRNLIKTHFNIRRGFFFFSLSTISKKKNRFFKHSFFDLKNFYFEEKSFKRFFSKQEHFIKRDLRVKRRRRRRITLVKSSPSKLKRPSFFWRGKKLKFFINFFSMRKFLPRKHLYKAVSLTGLDSFKRNFNFRTLNNRFYNYYKGRYLLPYRRFKYKPGKTKYKLVKIKDRVFKIKGKLVKIKDRVFKVRVKRLKYSKNFSFLWNLNRKLFI